MSNNATKKYNVGGVMLDRPFKIRRLGHFGFNASDCVTRARELPASGYRPPLVR